jgi:flagellar hook-associated protein 1 FlgK
VFEKPNALAAAAATESVPGGSGNAVLLGKLAKLTNVFGNRTPSEAYGEVVGLVGTRRAGAASDATLKQDVFLQAEAARESLGGVSLDEEMVNLQRYQRAYEAAAKVLSTVDSLLEELLARIGR